MVKIDKEVEVLEYSVVKMGSRVISMHETLQRLVKGPRTGPGTD